MPIFSLVIARNQEENKGEFDSLTYLRVAYLRFTFIR